MHKTMSSVRNESRRCHLSWCWLAIIVCAPVPATCVQSSWQVETVPQKVFVERTKNSLLSVLESGAEDLDEDVARSTLGEPFATVALKEGAQDKRQRPEEAEQEFSDKKRRKASPEITSDHLIGIQRAGATAIITTTTRTTSTKTSPTNDISMIDGVEIGKFGRAKPNERAQNNWTERSDSRLAANIRSGPGSGSESIKLDASKVLRRSEKWSKLRRIEGEDEGGGEEEEGEGDLVFVSPSRNVDVVGGMKRSNGFESTEADLEGGRESNLEHSATGARIFAIERRIRQASTAKAGPDSSLAIGPSNLGSAAARNSHQLMTNKSLKCRLERNLYLDFEEFKHRTCATCYDFLPKRLFKRKLLYNKSARIWLYDTTTNTSVLPDDMEKINATIKSEKTLKKLRFCCDLAAECCLSNAKYLPQPDPKSGQLSDRDGSDFCPATWDGIGCWPNWPAGQLARQRCTKNSYVNLDMNPACGGDVKKQCYANGSWHQRGDHEWSDFAQCSDVHITAARLFIAACWHTFSAIVVAPALLILDRIPERGGSKRLKMLRRLLFWLLINTLLAALHKFGMISRVFHATLSPDLPPPIIGTNWNRLNETRAPGNASNEVHTNLTQVLSSFGSEPVRGLNLSQRTGRQVLFKRDNGAAQATNAGPDNQLDLVAESPAMQTIDYNFWNDRDSWEEKLRKTNIFYEQLATLNNCYSDPENCAKDVDLEYQFGIKQSAITDQSFGCPDYNYQPPARASANFYATHYSHHLEDSNWNHNHESSPDQSNQIKRFKRATAAEIVASIRKSPWSVCVCWLVSFGIRVSRLLSYAWMFTSAIYLCSVLYCAPAEPKPIVVKLMMVVSDIFPIIISVAYTIARTIYEPSPLNLLFKLPYFHYTGNKPYIDYLWATQLDCWIIHSKHQFIENIVDKPNEILTILNAGLFIVTLIIMCRIRGPNSNQPGMRATDYFRAAGTLVLLYGAHHSLMIYDPPIESCIQQQAGYYTFLFVDGIQGIAVAYIFCYNTKECREVVSRWWTDLVEYKLNCDWCCFYRRKYGTKNNLLVSNNKSNNISGSSNNSAIFNVGITTTELIDVNSELQACSENV